MQHNIFSLTALSLFALGTATTALAADHHAFQLSSNQLQAEQKIPAKFEFNGFGCQGENHSPQLSWKNAPQGTKSFALSVYDPDAPTGSGFWHWYVVNISAQIDQLVADAGNVDGSRLPQGAFQLKTDYGYHGWGGVCPPAGDNPHRYIFTVHALNVEKLEVNHDTTTALGGFLVNAHTIEKASFTAYYQR